MPVPVEQPNQIHLDQPGRSPSKYEPRRHNPIHFLKGEKLAPRLLFGQVEAPPEPDPEAHLLFDGTTAFGESFGPSTEVGRKQRSGNERSVLRGIGGVSCVCVTTPRPSGPG